MMVFYVFKVSARSWSKFKNSPHANLGNRDKVSKRFFIIGTAPYITLRVKISVRIELVGQVRFEAL